MTEQVTIELIRAVAIIPGAIGGIAAAWFSYRSSIHSKDAAISAREIAVNTNGMQTDLNNLTAKSSFAAGKLEGEKSKQDNKPL